MRPISTRFDKRCLQRVNCILPSSNNHLKLEPGNDDDAISRENRKPRDRLFGFIEGVCRLYCEVNAGFGGR